MNRFEEGYIEGKRNARYFNTVEEIKLRYSHLNESFIKGFISAFDKYWNEKLMGEF